MKNTIEPDFLKKHFNKIAVAVTFSSRLEPIIAESGRLKKIADSEYYFIHVGHKTSEKEQILDELFKKYEFEKANIIWGTGNKVNAILDICESMKIELLIAGALSRETMLQYYIGSVARQIIRKSYCSVLLLSEPAISPRPYKRIAINFSEERDNETLALIGISIAVSHKSEKVFLTKETDANRFKLLLNKDLSEAELKETQKEIIKEENEVFDSLLKKIEKFDVGELDISSKLLYGKPGSEIRDFALENRVDFLVIHSPYKKLNLIDRIFQHDLEYLLENLPSDILMVHS
ncbi:MAG: universal stress protein [Bacteroidales bacterium]|jgi:nucleotide-binding universal stress UspA family protein